MPSQPSRNAFVNSEPANSKNLPVVNSIFDFSAEALGQLKTWLEGAGLAIPITQVLGFSGFTATVDQVTGTDTTTSTSYVSPTTVTGPTISGLADGQYVVVLKANLKTSSSSGLALASMSYNGSTPLDTDAAVCGVTTGLTSCVGIAKVTLNNGGNNTIDTQFRSEFNTVTVTLGNRTLVALRFAN